MTHSMESKFRYSITHWFQPIYHLSSNEVIGYEALLRDCSELHASPVNIFRDAEIKGYKNFLDLASIKNALKIYKNDSYLLFLNIFPSTLLIRNFILWWDANVSASTPIVLELVENECITDWNRLKIVTEQLRARGVKIAVDDVGEGYSTIRQWIELDPDYIKLGKYFAKNLSVTPKKQKVLKGLASFLLDTTKIIIEGIEREEDRDVAEYLGIQYAQGYLLGKPSPIEELYNIK